MTPYITIETEAIAFYEIQKSKFIACLHPAHTEEEARAFLKQKKKEFFDARHNCSAWIFGEQSNQQKSNDDGEPGGTAGNPILERMKQAKLTNVILVVTRYFGGIKLGASGLIRAYGHSAGLAIESASLIHMTPFTPITINFSYPLLSTVENLLRTKNVRVGEKTYAEDVALELLLTAEEEAPILAALTECTAANFKKTRGKERFLPLPLKK